MPASASRAILREALTAARDISPPYACVGALINLSHHLPAAERQPIVEEARVRALAIDDPSVRAHALTVLGFAQPEILVGEAAVAVEAIDAFKERHDARGSLLRMLALLGFDDAAAQLLST